MKADGRRQVVVIGLDGAPYSFLNGEIAAGNLPNMKALSEAGRMAAMHTDIPTISSVAWASFMTGANPGEHGIFGFTDRRPGSWDLYFPNYENVRVAPVWDTISAEGGRCCVLNVPSTYPARPVNGVLVSGFVAPNLERAVYPREAYDWLNAAGYRIDVDAAKARESLDLLVEDLHATLEKRREAFLHFWRQERWDLFVAVFTGTDRLHHFLWRFYEEDDATYRAEFLRFYRRLDDIIGELRAAIPADAALFMLSDHGFCTVRREVFPNALLRDEGFLSFTTDTPQTIMDINPATSTAYCMDPGRIYLNMEGREPGGTVTAAEADGLCAGIAERLLALKDPETGQPVLERVERGENLFRGSCVPDGPQLVAVPNRGFDVKGRMSPQAVADPGIINGMHTHDDAFVLVGPGVDATPPAHIRGLAPLMLQAWKGG